jgi:hypothetical protein
MIQLLSTLLMAMRNAKESDVVCRSGITVRLGGSQHRQVANAKRARLRSLLPTAIVSPFVPQKGIVAELRAIPGGQLLKTSCMLVHVVDQSCVSLPCRSSPSAFAVHDA